MAASQSVVINTYLAGVKQFLTGAGMEAEAMTALGRSASFAGTQGVLAGKQFNVANQAMFTLRRASYSATLALVAGGAAALHMGWSYRNALQEAQVALRPVFKDQVALNDELTRLFRIAAFTPFQFKDVTVAFRQMYAAFHPLGISVKDTEQMVSDLIDALSFAGKVTPSGLNRVSLAMQHLAFQGHLTGYAVNQLSRDGIPLLAVLRTQFHLTGEEIHKVGTLGIPVQDVLAAIQNYIRTTPGYAGAAMRQATGTLYGAWSTFKDLLSQAVGGAQGGIFGSAQKFFSDIDKVLEPYTRSRKPLTLLAFVSAIDQIASPKSHIVLNFFTLLTGVLQGFVGTLKVLNYVMTQMIANTFGRFGGGGNWLNWVFRAFGIYLGIALAVMILFRTWAIATAIAELFWKSVVIGLNAARLISILLMNREARAMAIEYLARGKFLGIIIRTTRALKLMTAALIFGGRNNRMWINMGRAEKLMVRLRFAFIGATSAAWAFIAPLLANPITWIVIGIIALIAGLVVLYYKWSWFHKLVDRTWHWIVHHWKLLAVILLGPFVIPLILIASNIRKLWSVIKSIFNKMIHLARIVGSVFKRIWSHIPGHGVISGVVKHIPFLAEGGMARTPGLAMVGERGPELVMMPAGASVIPNREAFRGQMMPKFPDIHLTSILKVDGKTLAKTTQKHKLDAAARE